MPIPAVAGIIGALLPSIAKSVGTIIDRIVPDKTLAQKIKAEATREILIQNHDEYMAIVDGQVKIILAEAKGGLLQRNWRPILMLVIVFIVANNYVIYPYLSFFTENVTILELPKALWNLMSIGVGGYIVGRSAEQISKNLKSPSAP